MPKILARRHRRWLLRFPLAWRSQFDRTLFRRLLFGTRNWLAPLPIFQEQNLIGNGLSEVIEYGVPENRGLPRLAITANALIEVGMGLRAAPIVL